MKVFLTANLQPHMQSLKQLIQLIQSPNLLLHPHPNLFLQ